MLNRLITEMGWLGWLGWAAFALIGSLYGLLWNSSRGINLRALKTQVREDRTTIERLQKLNLKYQRMNDDLQATVKALQADNTTLHKELERVRAVNAKQTEIIEGMGRHQKAQDERIERLERLYGQSQEQNTQLKDRVTELAAKLGRLE